MPKLNQIIEKATSSNDLDNEKNRLLAEYERNLVMGDLQALQDIKEGEATKFSANPYANYYLDQPSYGPNSLYPSRYYANPIAYHGGPARYYGGLYYNNSLLYPNYNLKTHRLPNHGDVNYEKMASQNDLIRCTDFHKRLGNHLHNHPHSYHHRYLHNCPRGHHHGDMDIRNYTHPHMHPNNYVNMYHNNRDNNVNDKKESMTNRRWYRFPFKGHRYQPSEDLLKRAL